MPITHQRDRIYAQVEFEAKEVKDRKADARNPVRARVECNVSVNPILEENLQRWTRTNDFNYYIKNTVLSRLNALLKNENANYNATPILRFLPQGVTLTISITSTEGNSTNLSQALSRVIDKLNRDITRDPSLQYQPEQRVEVLIQDAIQLLTAEKNKKDNANAPEKKGSEFKFFESSVSPLEEAINILYDSRIPGPDFRISKENIARLEELKLFFTDEVQEVLNNIYSLQEMLAGEEPAARFNLDG